HSTRITAHLNAAALPPARHWQPCLTKFVELCATKCGATSATRAGQSRSRPSTESPVAGARRRCDRHARAGQRLGFHRAPAGRRDTQGVKLGEFFPPSPSPRHYLPVFSLIMAIRRSVTGSRLAGDSSVMGFRLGIDSSVSSPHSSSDRPFVSAVASNHCSRKDVDRSNDLVRLPCCCFRKTLKLRRPAN